LNPKERKKEMRHKEQLKNEDRVKITEVGGCPDELAMR